MPPYAVLACSAVFFWSLSLRVQIWTLMPAIATDLGLSTSVAGAIISALLLGSNLGIWSSGWLPGSRKMRIMASTVFTVLGFALVSTAGDLVSLAVFLAALGFAAGVYLPPGLSIITDAGGESRKALYMSVHEVTASVASFCGAAYVAVALGLVGWRGSILTWCAVGVVAVLVFSGVPGGDGRASHAGSRSPLRLSWVLVYCCVGFAAAAVMQGGLTSALPLIMVRGFGVDPAEAASMLGYSRLAGLLGNLIVGLRADRWGHVRVMRGLLLVGVAGCAAMSVGGYGPLFVAGLLVVGVSAAGLVTVLPPAIASALPREQREQAMSVSVGAGGLAGSVGAPVLFGFLVDLGMPGVPMMLSAMVGLVGLVLTGQIPSRPGLDKPPGC